MFKKLLRTQFDMSIFIIRIALAIVILPHGLQKALGLFGGMGFAATIDVFQTKMGIPLPLAAAAILAESLFAFFLLIGLFTRISALMIGVTMAVAMTIHLPNGFFMNWFGNQAGEGIEYFIPILAIAISLLIKGGGAFSVDQLID